MGLNVKPVATAPETPVLGDQVNVLKAPAPTTLIVVVLSPLQITSEACDKPIEGGIVTVATTGVMGDKQVVVNFQL